MPRKSNIYKKRKGLAEDQIGLVIKPQLSVLLKMKSNYVIIKSNG